MAENGDTLTSGAALARLTEYADATWRRETLAYLDELSAGLPPPPPLTVARRFSWWVRDRRWQFADWLRAVADKMA